VSGGYEWQCQCSMVVVQVGPGGWTACTERWPRPPAPSPGGGCPTPDRRGAEGAAGAGARMEGPSNPSLKSIQSFPLLKTTHGSPLVVSYHHGPRIVCRDQSTDNIYPPVGQPSDDAPGRRRRGRRWPGGGRPWGTGGPCCTSSSRAPRTATPASGGPGRTTARPPPSPPRHPPRTNKAPPPREKRKLPLLQPSSRVRGLPRPESQ